MARTRTQKEINEKREKWDRHFLELALLHAKLSKDPNTQVGAVIVGSNDEIISAGFNGFPRGIEDTEERLNYRQLKLKLVVHAEMNAILAAARQGIRLEGATMFMAATNKKTGQVWGGPPCTRCTVEMIQAGIKEVVVHPMKSTPSKWETDLNLAASLLGEAGIGYRELPTEKTNELRIESPELWEY
jgi:dCMP deaminase